MRQKKPLIEEEIASITSSNEAKDSVCDDFVRVYEKTKFQDLESSLRTMRLEDDIKFVSEKCNSNVIPGIPPGI